MYVAHPPGRQSSGTTLILHELSFEHLLPFRERQAVPMHNLGLVLIRGDNRISQAADSNGTGKTSVPSILSFAWFGVSLPTPLAPSGRRGDDMACRFTKAPGIASIAMEDDQGPWRVIRQVRPKKLTVEGFDLAGDEDDRTLQDMIEARLGFGPRTFRNAIVFGQGAFERFAQADQSDQLRMLDEIHGMDLRQALERAKQWRDGLTSQVSMNEAKAESDAMALSRERDALAELERAREMFMTDQADRVKKIRASLTAALTGMKTVETAEKTLRANQATLTALLTVWQQIEKAVSHRNVCIETEQEQENNTRSLQEKSAVLDTTLRDLVEHDQCPTCRTSLAGSAAKKRVKASFLPDLTRANQALTIAMRSLTAARDARIKAVEAEERLWAGHPDIDQTIRRLTAETSQLAQNAVQREVDRCRNDLARINTELETEQARIWSGQDALGRSQQRITDLDVAVRTAQTTAAKLRRSVRVADYWVDAFGDRGIRSLLLDESAGVINDRLAYHLGILAGGEALTELAATRALKGGGTRERITITSKWAWGGEGLGSGSGGQDRRVDLALFAALQDLAEMRSARPFPLKVFDEPLDALDSRGKEIGATWVKQQARDRGTAFLITHSEELETLVEADTTWTVVLDTGGARIERV